MGSDVPALVTDPSVIELSDNSAPRSCKACGDPADFYVFVDDEQAEERTGVELGNGEWPINAFLCREHFRSAPRVDSLGEHSSVGE